MIEEMMVQARENIDFIERGKEKPEKNRHSFY
jgi:hypothetical protein